MDGDISIDLFDMGIQLALVLNATMHAIYVTIVVRRPSAFRRTV
jgi:hypothetical protein